MVAGYSSPAGGNFTSKQEKTTSTWRRHENLDERQSWVPPWWYGLFPPIHQGKVDSRYLVYGVQWKYLISKDWENQMMKLMKIEPRRDLP